MNRSSFDLARIKPANVGMGQQFVVRWVCLAGRWSMQLAAFDANPRDGHFLPLDAGLLVQPEDLEALRASVDGAIAARDAAKRIKAYLAGPLAAARKADAEWRSNDE